MFDKEGWKPVPKSSDYYFPSQYQDIKDSQKSHFQNWIISKSYLTRFGLEMHQFWKLFSQEYDYYDDYEDYNSIYYDWPQEEFPYKYYKPNLTKSSTKIPDVAEERQTLSLLGLPFGNFAVS